MSQGSKTYLPYLATVFMTNAQDMNTALDNPRFSLQHLPIVANKST